MLKKVGVTITSVQYSVSDEIYNAFCDEDNGEDLAAHEEALEAALANVTEGQPNTSLPQMPPEEESDTLEIYTEGRLLVQDGSVSLIYTETEMSESQETKTTIRFLEKEPKNVSMLRLGEVNTAFLFEEGVRTKCVYNMIYGSLELTIRTVRVDNRLMTDGCLTLEYFIELRGASAEHKCVTIKIRQ